MQYLIRQNRLGLMDPVIEKIGKYYYDDPKTKTNGEFDVVTLDEKGYAFYRNPSEYPFLYRWGMNGGLQFKLNNDNIVVFSCLSSRDMI